MNLCILSLDKGQDFGLYGKGKNSKEEEFDWMVGCDGHGSNQVINILRTIDWNVVMSQDDSLQEVINIINRFGIQYQSSGSTYIEAKIFKDRVETCSVGDSKIMVFVDNKLYYENKEHNLFNPSEKERLQERIDEGSMSVEEVHSIPHVLTPENITTQTKHYYNFNHTYKLAMTQSLGHNNVTGILPERKNILYTPENKIRVLLMSDGVQDIICSESEPEYYEKDIQNLSVFPCSEIASLAEQRWKQKWQYYLKKDDELFMSYCFATPSASRSGFDDVLVVTCDIYPGKTEEEKLIEEVINQAIEQALEQLREN